ncbi:Uncharacterised protein [Mycobacteroides abscessus]|nr:Uncharacterised protein [Mycobacteroides abscessus]
MAAPALNEPAPDRGYGSKWERKPSSQSASSVTGEIAWSPYLGVVGAVCVAAGDQRFPTGFLVLARLRGGWWLSRLDRRSTAQRRYRP